MCLHPNDSLRFTACKADVTFDPGDTHRIGTGVLDLELSDHVGSSRGVPLGPRPLAGARGSASNP